MTREINTFGFQLPYPGQLSSATMSVREARSRQRKAGGTSGGVEPSFAPIDTARTPALFRSGISARVSPGTSRCDNVAFRDMLKRSSRAHVRARPASMSEGSITASSALCGNACHVMSPAATAPSNVATAAELGQCSPRFGGQSRYIETTHDWNMKARRLLANEPFALRNAAPCCAAYGKWWSKYRFTIPAEESANPMSRWHELITCTVETLGYVGAGVGAR